MTRKSPEEIKAIKRRYYETHREQVREANRKYRETHRVQERERRRKWQKDHSDSHRESNRKWREANPEKARECVRRSNAAHPEHKRETRRKRQYGLTPEKYEQMLIDQNGTCAICETNQVDRPLGVDHDHDTKVVRGLLCRKCNLAIGYMDDSSDRLRKAAEYLEKPA